jgi:hypothetical protein
MSVEVAPVIAEVTVVVDTAALTVTPLLASLTVTPSPAPVVDVTVQQVAVEVAGAGVPGPTGATGAPGNVAYVIAAEPMPALTVVTVRTDGLGYRASSDTTADSDRILGIASNSAIAGEQVAVYETGEIIAGSPVDIGPLYLNTDGSLTPSANTGAYQLIVAYALTTTRIAVRVGLPIYR